MAIPVHPCIETQLDGALCWLARYQSIKNAIHTAQITVAALHWVFRNLHGMPHTVKNGLAKFYLLAPFFIATDTKFMDFPDRK